MKQSLWIQVTPEHLAEWWEDAPFSSAKKGDIIIDPFRAGSLAVASWPQQGDEFFASEDGPGLLNEQKPEWELRARMKLHDVELF